MLSNITKADANRGKETVADKNLLKHYRRMIHAEFNNQERDHYFKEIIVKTRGLDIAADVIEQALKKASTEKQRIRLRDYSTSVRAS